MNGWRSHPGCEPPKRRPSKLLPPRTAAGTQAAERLDHEANIREQGGAQLTIAEALLRSGNGGGAIAWARQARATYLTIPPSSGTARCLLIEGRARELDRDASAELAFRGALRECQALRPVPALLEAEIACDLILHLGEKSQWSAARSVYDQVRPSGNIGRVDDRRPPQRPAGRVRSLYQLAERQAQVAIMAAELCLHPLEPGEDAAAASCPEETQAFSRRGTVRADPGSVRSR